MQKQNYQNNIQYYFKINLHLHDLLRTCPTLKKQYINDLQE